MMSDNRLPTQRDFDPWVGNLDAQCAWKNFGGLSLEEAHAKFRENPLHYQEDFMWMGGRAFAFYFSVIEDYLTDCVRGTANGDVAKILASCIEMQFHGDNLASVQHLASRVLALAEFVRANIEKFGSDGQSSRDMTRAWNRLRNVVESVMQK